MQRLKLKLENEKFVLVCLFIIIAIQCVISLYFGTQKNGFHQDEIATYQLANNTEGYIPWDYDAMDTWLSGSYYKDVTSVNADERFNFTIPYVNQEKDVHPILYYFVVHMVCSFFPETNWKWLGIAINLCFVVITSILLFKLSKAIMKSSTLALVSVIAWGWSIGSTGTTVYLRMYAMLGMWCVLFALLLTKLLQNISRGQLVKKRCWIELFLVTAAGILTQYYFLVFCFFACLMALIYLLIKREWGKSLIFSISEIGGVIFSYICFPAMIDQIFNGYRGEEAFENFASSESSLQNLREVLVKISRELFNGWINEIIVISIIVVILYWIFCIFHPKLSIRDGTAKLTATPSLPKQFNIILHMEREGIILILGVVCVSYIVLISRIAPYQSDRYYMCIFPILSLIAVFLLYTLCNYIIKNKTEACILSLVLILFITGASYIKQDVPYLYTDRKEREEILSEYYEYPVIVINFSTINSSVNPWVYEFAKFSEVYRCSHGSFDKVENAINTKDLSGGFLVYAVGSNLSDDEFIGNLSNYIEISDWEVLTDISTKVYFCEPAN